MRDANNKEKQFGMRVPMLTIRLVLVLAIILTIASSRAEDGTAQSSLKKIEGQNGGSQKLTLEQQLKAAQESLLLANAEAEYFRSQWQKIRMRNEALGVDAITGDERRMQERMISAVQELYQTEKERRQAIDRLEKLMEAGQRMLKGAQGFDPKDRAEYEVAVRQAREVLESSGKKVWKGKSELTDAEIVAVNSDLNTVVIDIGNINEAKVGMPFRVFRDSRLIGRIRVLQTREQVSAALVESVEKGKELKIGDRVKIATEK